jgi:hypothetical protein
MNIWQISQDLYSIFSEIEENDGELTEELEKQLEITQADFVNKVRDYSAVIRKTEADIKAINDEIKRLQEYKKTKERLIERLNKILIPAIEMFGDTTKSGGKFVDYGTGKISIRNSTKVELDDNKTKAMASELGRMICTETFLAGASNRENITKEELINKCLHHSYIDKETEEMILDGQTITSDDIDNTNIEIKFTKPLKSFMFGEGYNVMKDIYSLTPVVTIEPKINKISIKEAIDNNANLSIAKVVQNKTISIK